MQQRWKVLRIVIVVGICLAMVPWTAWSNERAYNFKAQTPMNAALRSLLIPGLGQFFNEQPTKGFILVGAEAASIGVAFMLHSKANSTYEDYEQKRTDALYDDYSSQFDTANMFVYLSAAIWAWNVVDAYLCGGEFDEEPVRKKQKRKPKREEENEEEEEDEEEDDWDSKVPLREKINLQITKNNEVFLTYTRAF